MLASYFISIRLAIWGYEDSSVVKSTVADDWIQFPSPTSDGSQLHVKF